MLKIILIILVVLFVILLNAIIILLAHKMHKIKCAKNVCPFCGLSVNEAETRCPICGTETIIQRS
ncbi:MAG: hypothetical protein IJZ35_08235 [Clostridia bacterium]|nr:hypothetical protein [Clostridia bacterium]